MKKHQQRTHITHVYHSIRYCNQGLKILWQEMAFRQEVYIGIPAGLTLFFIDTPILHQVIYWILLLIVFATESLNTCIEYIGNKIDPNPNPFTGAIKDMGAFAVLCIIIATTLWWGYSLFISL